jgi:hypothetical protein
MFKLCVVSKVKTQMQDNQDKERRTDEVQSTRKHTKKKIVLRRGSAADRLLGLRVRIPLVA